MSPDESTPTTSFPAMSASERDAERSRGRQAGIAALLAVLLIAVALIWTSQFDPDDTGGKPVIAQKQQPVTAHSKSQDAPLTAKEKEAKEKAKQDFEDDKDEANALASIDNHVLVFVGAALLNAVAFLLLLFPARALFLATKAREPREASIVGFLAVYGPIALCVGTLIRALALKYASADFVDQQFANYPAAADEAANLKEGGAFVFFQALTLSGLLAFAFWLIKGVWDASKVGLLPKPYAVLGMALPLLTLIATPLALPIAVFWMVALGLLFLGRWPSGIPPAWEAGRAIPWPARGARIVPVESEAGGERNGDVVLVDPGAIDVEVDGDDEPQPENPDVPPEPRRKRKRRD